VRSSENSSASDKGLGYIIINSQYTMGFPADFAGLMLVSLFGVALFRHRIGH
jgi:ABC-type nitrate/sulfonate/bicarbonate transport system permease component